MTTIGLAEALRQELMPYGIHTHIMFPGTILTPGYEEENKMKPAITKEIEGVDEGQTPEAVSRALLRGLSFPRCFNFIICRCRHRQEPLFYLL
jgi:3-dehydrosphinganine reductase